MPTKKATDRPRGRPTKKNPEALARIIEVARTGLPLKFAAQAGNITYDALVAWQQRDPEFARELTQARLKAVEDRWELIRKAAAGSKDNPPDWRAAAWSLERVYYSDFARPEFQFSFNNNLTQNNLTITISPEEAREIEAEAVPVREKVRALFEEYQQRRGGQGNGNGDGSKTVEVQAESVKKPEVVAPPIVRKAGDEKSAVFWALFASGTGERPVERQTALYVVRTIVSETLGTHRCGEVRFGSDPVTVADVLGRIDKLCGGSPVGWQLLQKKAGVAGS
jgi:hypothetical protein